MGDAVTVEIPPLPPGAKLDDQSSLPPLPAGAKLDAASMVPLLPPGATLDKPSGPSSDAFKSGPSTGGTEPVEPARFSRFMNGVSSGYAGAEQLLAHSAAYLAPSAAAGWSEAADQRAKSVEAEKAALAQKAGLAPDQTDWVNVAGQVASPVNWAGTEGVGLASKAIPLVRNSNIAKGVLQGATAASTQPVTSPDYWDAKAKQAAVGGLAGPVLPVVQAAGKGISAASPYAINIAKQYLTHSPEEMILNHLTGGLSAPVTGAKRVWDAVKETNAARATAKASMPAAPQLTQAQMDEVARRQAIDELMRRYVSSTSGNVIAQGQR